MSTETDPFAALEAAAERLRAEANGASALSSARTRLLMGRDARSAFFASLALRLKPVPDWNQKTASTDGREFRYSPAYMAGLTPAEMLGTIAHAVMHCALAHFARCESRDDARWQTACDLAVNPMLRECGFELPAGSEYPDDDRHGLPVGLTAEEYYEKLQSKEDSGSAAPDVGEGDGDGQGDGHGNGQGSGPAGVHSPPDPAAAADAQARWQVATAQASQAAKTRGEMPADLARMIGEILQPEADWRAVLREFVSCAARDDYSWSRPSRRSHSLGMYLPGIRSDAMGTVAVLIDTSGSVGEEELSRFAAELQDALTVYPCKAVILYHDSAVAHRQEWQPSDGPLVLEPKGGGGTDHRPAFAALAELDECPTLCLCLTDGYTSYPETSPDFPVLWGMTTDQDPPWGQVVRL